MLKKFYKRYEKEILFLAFIVFFMLPYFLINHLTQFRDTRLIGTIIDEQIPFITKFIPIYLSSYVMALLPYFFIKDMQIFRKFIISSCIILTVGFSTFLIYPVEIIRPEILHSDFFSTITKFFFTLDAPYNTFPSLHVALSFIIALSFYQYHKKYSRMLIRATLIAISTLFVKQHYFFDVVGGLLISFMVYSLIHNKKIEKISEIYLYITEKTRKEKMESQM